jgi:hypothetical protein
MTHGNGGWGVLVLVLASREGGRWCAGWQQPAVPTQISLAA